MTTAAPVLMIPSGIGPAIRFNDKIQLGAVLRSGGTRRLNPPRSFSDRSMSSSVGASPNPAPIPLKLFTERSRRLRKLRPPITHGHCPAEAVLPQDRSAAVRASPPLLRSIRRGCSTRDRGSERRVQVGQAGGQVPQSAGRCAGRARRSRLREACPIVARDSSRSAGSPIGPSAVSSSDSRADAGIVDAPAQLVGGEVERDQAGEIPYRTRHRSNEIVAGIHWSLLQDDRAHTVARAVDTEPIAWICVDPPTGPGRPLRHHLSLVEARPTLRQSRFTIVVTVSQKVPPPGGGGGGGG